MAEKVKIINYAQEIPHLSSRKLAEEFGCGRTCIQILIKQKEDILTDWKCCENLSCGDLKNSKTLTRLSGIGFVWQLIPVSGPMIQEEALQIALKLNVTGFTASNGWLEKWKTRHHVKQFSVAGEDGEVNAETSESRLNGCQK